MLVNKFTKNIINKSINRFFHLLTPEEYFINYKESSRKLGIDSAKLIPLPEASKYI